MELKRLIKQVEKEVEHLKDEWKKDKLDNYSKGYCSALETVLKELKNIKE